MSTFCSTSFASTLSVSSPQGETNCSPFAKQCQPQQPSPSDSDDGICHRGKRRCRNNHTTIDHVEDCPAPVLWPRQVVASKSQTNHVSQFPTTSSAFGIFPSSSPLQDNRCRSSSPASSGYQEGQDEGPLDLARLRTSAFWELRQSVTENGEGLIRRMRDYERSRSRHHTHQKAKDAEKRGRKRLTRRQKTFVNASEDDDEDILISSGDVSSHIQWSSFLCKRSRSLDVMNVDGKKDAWSSAHHTRSQSSGPPSDNHYISGPELDGEDSASWDDAMCMHDSFTNPMLEPTPALSHSSYESANSSLLSLALPPVFKSEAALPSTVSEKALAALSLALENGAGSITDYSSIWKYQEQFNLGEGHDHGELWK